MKYFDFTLPTPAENLACDEALLDWCEAGGGEILRFWEPARPFVVVGYANHVAQEVNVAACDERGIPIFRRCSGGGTVVQGPGCLNYSLILKIQGAGGAVPSTANISSTNRLVMERNRVAIQGLMNAPVQIRGHTDLASESLKFSGNAQRRLRKALIFHGTFLLEFDLALIEQVLQMPSKQPDYRKNRPHVDFLTSLNIPAARVKEALRNAWQADTPLPQPPSDSIRKLAAEKYSTREWNLKF